MSQELHDDDVQNSYSLDEEKDDLVANGSNTKHEEAMAVANTEQNAVSKFFGGILTAAKERMLGDTWWLPSDTKEVAEIPAKYLASNHTELERHEELILLKGAYTAATFYHITIVWKKDGKMYTIWRSNLLAATKDFLRSVAPFAVLFKYLDSPKDIKSVTMYTAKHPLWKPVHIAARMNLLGFFEDAHLNGSLPALMSQACQPEGRYPIHLAVYYNLVDLTKKLFSFGASVAQTDSRGQTALHYGARTSPTMLEVLCAHPEASKCMNALNSDGYTPLFLAISSCRPTCVAALMQRGAVLNMTCQGRSALHEAMLQNNDKVSDVVKTLVEACPAAITEADPLTGNSLLHTSTNKKSLAALAAVTPKIDKNIKNKAGQTALHWHVQRDDLGMVIALITLGVDLDAQDNDGNTPLHLAVSRGNIDIVKALLVLGCDVNISNSSGDSAFHLATRLNDREKFDIIRCLIVCGAKACPQNKRGCTAQCAYRNPGQPPRPPPPYSTLIDVIPPSTRPTKTGELKTAPSTSDPTLSKKDASLKDRTSGSKSGPPQCDCSGTALDMPVKRAPPLSTIDQVIHDRCVERVKRISKELKEKGAERKLQVILSFDGGGIRGLVLAQTLLALQRELDEPILDYVDWLAGTSTGAFIAAALARGKTLRECQHMYLQFKDQIFECWMRPYNTEVLERFVSTTFGAQTTMADIKRPNFMITTTAADKIPIRLHLLRNYQLPLSKEENEQLCYADPQSQILWKALRCSSAAPTYFTSVDNKFVDGGLAANNPTMEMLSEIQRYNNALEYMGKPEEERLKIGCVISVGTGALPEVPSESLTFAGLESFSAARTLGMMLLEQACATEGSPVERSRAWLQYMGAPLFRLNPLLSKEYMLDTKDDKEVVAMMWEAEEYVRERAAQFKELAGLLKTLKDD